MGKEELFEGLPEGSGTKKKSGHGVSDIITYKSYDQGQMMLLPPSIEELVPEGHLVRLVNEVIEEIGVERIIAEKLPGGGAGRYHPAMMVKIIVYGYMTGVCSSRKIAKAARENVLYMWLAGGNKPAWRAANDFRGELLAGMFTEIFVAAVKMLAAKGYIKLENYFIDGTKIESASGRYTYVWKRSVEKNDARLGERLRGYVEMADAAWKDENDEYGDKDLEELGGKDGYTSEDVKKIAAAIRNRIRNLEAAEDEAARGERKEEKKGLEKAAKEAENGCLEKKMRHEAALDILGERNSYSKTGHDATFMRLKDDHMRNGQTKPAYNVQTAVEDGFAVGYGIYPNPGDTKTLKPFLEERKELLGGKPEAVITDGGYGSEENYQYLEDEGITAVVKYSGWMKERSKKHLENPFNTDNWEFDDKDNCYICPAGRKLAFIGKKEKENHSGYKINVEVYRCENCDGCRFRKECAGPKSNRRIEYNENWNRLKKKARETLESGAYKPLRKRRSQECETVHGQIKSNQGFNRFLLRGNKKVSCEWGILLLGFNIKQIYRKRG